METEKEWSAKILALTLRIQTEHPELSKLLDETPITIPNQSNPKININILKDYYDSLCNLVMEHKTVNVKP